MRLGSSLQDIAEINEYNKKLQENFKDFLENYSLFRKTSDYIPNTFSPSMLRPLQLVCPLCKQQTTHEYNPEKSQVIDTPNAVSKGGGTSCFTTFINKTDGSTLKFSYTCQHCKKRHYHFQVSFKDEKMFKSGQFPSMEIHIEKDIEDKLGEKLADLYRKGKTCETHGLGIASMAYYRRVIEDKVKDILIEVKNLIPEENKDEYTKEIEGIMDLHSFEQKADFIYESMPPSLKPDGQNLLKLLFRSVSEGLHSKDDNDCLEIAVDTSQLLEMIIHILNVQIQTEKALHKLINRLAKSKN